MSRPLRIIYAGTPVFSVPALQALNSSVHEVVAVYTQPDRPAGRGRDFKASPVKQKAIEYGFAVYQPETLKSEQAQQELTALNADLMVVAAYGLILPAAVLAMPRLGCVNIHASLLPRWRGAAPIQRAILAGDTKTGITIMQMDEGLDTGAMLAVAECEIRPDDTGSSLHDRLMQLGADTLMTVLPAIAEQAVNAVRQNEAESCYAARLSKAEARINWQLPAVDIQRAIRAYNAWPVAFCYYQKNKQPALLRIWQAEVQVPAGAATAAVPGEVIAESAAGIDVVTGEGVLRITQLQAEGKRRLPAADFVNASSLQGQLLS